MDVSPLPRVGLQLYSVRTQLAEDPGGTLRRIADLGIAGIETAGFAGEDPMTFRRRLDDLGLAHISTAVGVSPDGLDAATLDLVEQLDVPRLIVNGPPQAFATLDSIHALARSINAAAAQLDPLGRTIGYHQHYWELTPTDISPDPMAELVSRLDGCFLELDLYWLAAARPDWRATVETFGHLVRLVHVKDGPATLPGPGWQVDPQVPAGSGAVDIAGQVRALPTAEWLVIEYDLCTGDIFDAIDGSRRYLVEAGLARPD